MEKYLSTILIIFFSSYVATGQTSADFSLIKNRVENNLLQIEANDSLCTVLLKNIRADGTWPEINYQDVSRTGFEHRFQSSNMLELARSYRSKSSKYHKDQKVLDAIAMSLENWVAKDYTSDNWWYNQIGIPRNFVDLMLLVGNTLDQELVLATQKVIGRANLDAPGARPSGDRIKICGIMAKNTLFLDDEKLFTELVTVIQNEIKYEYWEGVDYGFGYKITPNAFKYRASGGRGLQYDHSFHHRLFGVNNTLSYGTDYAAVFAEWAAYTAKTRYSFSEEKINILVNYFLDGICKMMVFGKYPDAGAKNRSIARPGSLAPLRDGISDKLILATTYRNEELQEISNIRTKHIPATTSHATYYWNTEHFTYQRPHFFTSVRMYSTRNYNMEKAYNGEGIFNHHRADGANYISRTGTEYKGMAAVFDYQKIPGTTIVQKPQMASPKEIQKIGLTSFVGAATDGRYAAVAYDFRSPHDQVVARKSWFFFDKEYVCLGSGISSTQKLPVCTTLNQCNLKSDVHIGTKNTTSLLEKGEQEYKDVNWVYQDSIGYFFMNPTKVSIKNTIASGSWSRINKQTDSPKEILEKEVFALWLDHGEQPVDATYEYIIQPNISMEQVKNHPPVKDIEILANTPYVQAVRHKKLNLFQVIFYTASEITLTEDLIIKSHTPSILMLKLENNNISQVTVADPNRQLSKAFFSISKKMEKVGRNYKMTWNDTQKCTDMIIDLPLHNYAGKSVTIK